MAYDGTTILLGAKKLRLRTIANDGVDDALGTFLNAHNSDVR